MVGTTMADRSTTFDAPRYRRNWQAEVDSAALYHALAEGEDNPQLAEVYRRLAATEQRHADLWADRLRDTGEPVAGARPSTRTRVLAWLARRVGPDLVTPIIAADERAERGMYDDQPETAATGMRTDERSHARLLGAITRDAGRRGGLEGSALARVEGRHRSIGGNALRAAVLGANDGLVSNLSLVMGVAGAAAGGALSADAIVFAGLAGLLAGAFSMAMGEWLSVQSAREAAQRQLAVEADELAEQPDEERDELTLIYQAKGMPEAEARAVADRLMADPDTALDALAREELGIDPDELGGSPWTAAAASFLLFVTGAVVPVAPFLLASGTAAVLASLVASGVALFGIGTAITLLTGRPALRSGLRQLAFGLGAAALTYGIGTLLGVSVSG